ncbi:MAG: F0F1 ATP synthase subunit B [Planctomycetota bacterium]
MIDQLHTHSHIIAWTFITFGIVVALLGKFVWPAILGALEAREKAIQDDLDGARKARDEAERLLEEHKRVVAGTEAQVRAMMDEARKDARVLKEDIEKKAQEEASKIRERTLRDIELAREAAVATLRSESIRLSALMASKVLGRKVESTDQDRLLEECLTELGSQRG